MSGTTTNLLGIVIAILAGTYFYICYCGPCNDEEILDFPPETPDMEVRNRAEPAYGPMPAGLAEKGRICNEDAGFPGFAMTPDSSNIPTPYNLNIIWN